MTYIEDFLRALKDLADDHNEVNIQQIKNALKVKINKHQLYSSIGNFSRETFDLIRPIGAGLYALNKENINLTHERYKNGEIKLWYNPDGQEIKNPNRPRQRKIGYTTDIAMAILSAYQKPLSIYDIVKIGSDNNFKLYERTIYAIFDKKKDIVSKKRIGKRFCYYAKPEFFESQDRSFMIKILPAKAEQINANFNKHVGNQTEQPTPEPEPRQIDQAPIPTIEASPEEDTNEYVEAANIGAAIIAYINKLKKKGAEIDPSEYEKLKAKYEDKQQDIINLKNQLASTEGQLSKTKKMIEDQNQTIIDLTHSVTVLKTEKERMKRIPSTFKLSEVANIKRAISDL